METPGPLSPLCLLSPPSTGSATEFFIHRSRRCRPLGVLGGAVHQNCDGGGCVLAEGAGAAVFQAFGRRRSVFVTTLFTYFEVHTKGSTWHVFFGSACFFPARCVQNSSCGSVSKVCGYDLAPHYGLRALMSTSVFVVVGVREKDLALVNTTVGCCNQRWSCVRRLWF